MFRVVVKLVLVAVFFMQFVPVDAQKRKTELDLPSTVVYALPRTVLNVDVVVEKKIRKVGPLVDFSEKYIGVSPQIKFDAVDWEIKSMDVSEDAEVDPQLVYKLTTVGNYEPNLIQLTPEGLIQGFNVRNLTSVESNRFKAFNQESDVEIEYGKFSIDPNLRIKKDTVYKVVETDTAFVKVAVLEEQAFAKTLEEKAKEAAHQLFKLRKRRFKILTSNYEVLPPDGKAYEVIVRELDRLEKDYLALFLGKEVSVFESRRFTYSPSSVSDKGGVLFRISPEKGLVDAGNIKAVPVQIVLKNSGLATELAVLPSDPTALPNSQIHYRVPGQAEVVISKGNEVLLKENHIVSQYGKIMTMPSQVMLHEGYSIEFYPKTGAIKSISKQE